MCEIGRALAEGPGRERHVHLVLENDANEAHLLGACASAQWNDDLHHVLHVLATGEPDGYYADYAQAPLERLGRALAEGFVYQGEPSAFRDGAPRGEPSAHLPPTAFVSFQQTHDQVGNRAFGERLDALAGPGADRGRARLRAARAAGADAVHGRGVRRGDAVPVLLRLRPRARRGGHARPARGVRALRLVRAGDPRPERRGTFLRSKLDRSAARARRASRWCASCSRSGAATSCRAWRARAAEPGRSGTGRWRWSGRSATARAGTCSLRPGGGAAVPAGDARVPRRPRSAWRWRPRERGARSARAACAARPASRCAGTTSGARRTRCPTQASRRCSPSSGSTPPRPHARRRPSTTRTRRTGAMRCRRWRRCAPASSAVAPARAGARGRAPALAHRGRGRRAPRGRGRRRRARHDRDGGDRRPALRRLRHRDPARARAGLPPLRARGRARRGAAGETLLVAAPERCWRPGALEDGSPIWGPSLQLYALRSRRNWGMGDFTDLLHLVEQWAARGAGVIGLNPLHALFRAQPGARQPLQPLLAPDAERAVRGRRGDRRPARLRAGAASCCATPQFQARLAALRDAALVDYRGRARGEVRAARAALRALPRAPPRARQHARAAVPRLPGRARRGAASARAVRGAAGALPPRGPRGVGLAAVARALPRPGGRGGGALRRGAARAGRVLRVPAVAGRAPARARRRALRRARHGAGAVPRPRGLGRPRRLGRLGAAGRLRARRQRRRAAGRLQPQGTGLGPAAAAARSPAPHRLRAVRRRAARGDGARRRAAHRPRDGADAAVLDPARRLRRQRRLRALRARRDARHPRAREPPQQMPGDRRGPRHGGRRDARGAGARGRAVVPAACGSSATAAGEFKPPADYPREALVAVSTHDLPTLAGWWEGDDLALRARLGLYPDESQHAAQLAERAADRARLLRALERERLAAARYRARAWPKRCTPTSPRRPRA